MKNVEISQKFQLFWKKMKGYVKSFSIANILPEEVGIEVGIGPCQRKVKLGVFEGVTLHKNIYCLQER